MRLSFFFRIASRKLSDQTILQIGLSDTMMFWPEVLQNLSKTLGTIFLKIYQ